MIVARRAARLPNVPAVLFSSRRSDADADVIRARLRALLESDRRWRRMGARADDEPTDRSPGGRTAPSGRQYRGDRRLSGRSGGSGPTLSATGSGAAPRTRSRHPLGSRAWGRPVAVDRGAGGGPAAGRLDLAGPPRRRAGPGGGAGRAALDDERSAPTPTVGEASQTSAAVVVSVVGLVVRPGLVTLPAGSRVADAVAAAGGLLRRPIQRRSISLPSFPTARRSRSAFRRGSRIGRRRRARRWWPGPGSRVDLNAATAADLDALPGIGPVLAQRIVDHRTRNGPFRSVDQLDDVPGIGPAIAAELAELVAV